MLSKFLKNTAIFLALMAVVFGVFYSCDGPFGLDNPFSNNMGEKVDIERPTISIISPAPGAYIKGECTFTGFAKANRMITGVFVSIHSLVDDAPPILEWTRLEDVTGDEKLRMWSYKLDTLNFPGVNEGLLKIQFQVFDTNLSMLMNHQETPVLVYIVKNLPSRVKMFLPDQIDLDNPVITPSLTAGTYLRGEVSDNKGIKPGYPQIKIWPSDMPEPSGDDLQWGWVSMFLTGIDSPDQDGGIYVDRYDRQREQNANFAFKLSKFTIDPDTRQARYSIVGGDYEPFDPKNYNFRIKTSDTFLVEDQNDPKYLYPRLPQEGEEDIIGWSPALEETDTDPGNSGPYYTVLVKPSGEPPRIRLNNDDISPTILQEVPNIYLREEDTTHRKILTGQSGRPAFRLRVLATHSLGVERATLEWTQPGSGRAGGTLDWDNGPTGTHLNPALPADGTIFEFTAKEGLIDLNGEIFTPDDSKNYVLTVTAIATSGETSQPQPYIVYLNKGGPTVNIEEIKGWSSEPSAAENFYTVNGNIKVVVSYPSGNIMTDSDRHPVVKWIVEEDFPGYDSDSSTIQKKIDNYRNTPSAANLAFFNGIAYDAAANSSATKGWEKEDRDGTRNFRFNTKNFADGKYLWLYIIAQNDAYNLGYTRVKLLVDQSKDIPTNEVPGLTSAITSKDGLFIEINADKTQANSSAVTGRNVLDKVTGIDLTFKDDDGISLVKDNIRITLTDLNAPSTDPNRTKSLTRAQIMEALNGVNANDSRKEWSGVLSQRIMAIVMYGANAGSSYLKDGMYRLDIDYRDDVDVKESIVPGDVAAAVVPTVSFYFAVISDQPKIEISNPEKNGFVTSTAVEITGTITSRVPVQRLWISFDPEVDKSPPGITLYRNSAYTTPAVWNTDAPDAGGVYQYYWHKTNVVFVKDPDFPQEERRFTVEAADNMGNFFNEEPWVVKVDKEPPEVALDDFYFSRGTPDKVNGKFDFIISAQDINGIGPSKDKQISDEVYIKWWIRNSETVPNWNETLSPPAGINGQFKTSDDTSGGRYRVIVNSGTVNSSYLDNGKYYLYAAAEDFAENKSVPKLLQVFTIDRESDYPVVDAGEQSPNNDIKQKADLKITGKVTDDDGFTGYTANTVQIRFKTAADSTTWESAWTNIPATLDPTGALTFEYVIPNSMKTGAGYFAGDGLKEYQIRVTDIQANKNPTANTVLNNAVIAAVSKIYPADNTGYSFILKDKKPEIFFASYDENDEKDENDHYTHEYSATRPVFRDRNALLAALNGGYVKDRYLKSVMVSYDRGTEVELLGADGQGAYTAGNLTPPLTEGTAQFDWNLSAAGIAWLPVEGSITEGMHTIIITARDLAGGTTSAEWKFYKDITGPVITANITKGNAADVVRDLPVVAAPSGDLFIKGRFDDEYSPINLDITSGNNPIYWFDGDSSTKYDMGISGETNNNKTVNWAITIPPSLKDGKHRFSLIVYDAVGNPSNLTDWYFVVDRKEPEVTKTNDMIVSGNLGTGFVPGPISDANENSRVFSAATVNATSTAVIFTLEGYAWDDSNLNSVSVSLRRGSVTNDVAVTAAPENMALTFRVDLPTVWSETANGYSQQSADADGQHRLTVTKDATTDRWKWTLNVLSKDLNTLKTGYTNGESCFVSVNARDVAQFNSELQHWRFFLDATAPVPEFSNIVLPNSSATPPVLPTVFEGNEVTMTGTVSDDNRVKTIRYYLQKYDYANNTWLRCAADANGTWSAGTPEWSTYTFTQTSLVTWTLDGTTLERGRYGSGNANLFAGDNGQGRYQLTIEAADFSLAASDAGNVNSLTREFYVDRADPAINWTGTSANQTAFRNKTGGIIELTLTASDVNYIAAAMTVEIKGPPSNAVLYTINYTYPATDAQISANPPQNNNGLWSQTITLKPVVNGGSNWAEGRYTLTLTIKDRAGKSASINHTREFEVHNIAPSITINDATGASPVTVTEAIVGRTPLRGEFTAKGSPVAFVAYYVSKRGIADDPELARLPKDTDLDYTSSTGKTTLANKGWRFADGTNNNLTNGSIKLMTIGSGLTNVTMLLPDASSLIDSFTNPNDNYGWANSSAGSSITFNGSNISGKTVNQLRIYFLAVDEAGNRNIVRYDYWIYPEGDRPTVTVSRPDETEKEERRLLNGRIRIGGTAKDNVRVKNVWFRILDTSNHPIIDRVQIPVWNDLGEATDAYQNNTQEGSKQITKARSGSASNDEYGWFMASGGGKAEVPWYAYINTNGELDPLLEGSRKITVEVLAEDTMQGEDGGWDDYKDKLHLYSSLKAIKATVVKGAPEFSDVRIKRSASGIDTTTLGRITTSSTFFDDKNVWVPLESANIRGRASYSVTVTHEAGIKEIMYTPAGQNPINLLPEYDDSIAVNDLKYDSYNTTTYATDLTAMDNSTPSGIGVAVKAGPKATLTGSVSLAANKTYLIWVWDDALKTLGLVPADSPDASSTPSAKKVMRFTTISGKSGSFTIGSAELIEGREVTENSQTKIKFDWVVVVDVHADLIENGRYKTGYPWNGVTVKSGRSPLELRATENSQSVALFTNFPAELPIDNDPPRANYTHNSYVVGPGATVGGDAGDTGPVNGLDKIVLWFSRNDGTGETPISWHEKAGGGVTAQSFEGNGTIPDGITNSWLTSATMPKDYAEGTATGNYSSIVIKYNDPLGQNARFGHKLPIGFATVGGDLSQSWYVTLDSTNINSGRITAHYIVYDKAGNVTYYTKRLVVMNGVPRISRITLATDIRGDKSLTGTGGSFTANGSYGLNRNDSKPNTQDNSLADPDEQAPMEIISGKFTSGTDIQRGISDYIAIDTDSASIRSYGVVYDEPFNVRNNLLAVKVEVPQKKGDGGKDRTFRVEYVSGGMRLSDPNNATTTSATNNGNNFYKAMRAGRIYMIENPGNSSFPWGSLGVQGNPQRGVAFMAIDNGDEVKIEVLDYRQGGVGPSVWELNSDYYTGNTLNRDNVPGALRLDDVGYNNTSSDTDGKSAEFVYAAGAFNQTQFTANEAISDSSKIHDFTPTVGADGRPTTYPYVANRPPWEVHSLFIVKVFGGQESELFGDFALLSIRVNNDDRTRPYAQLYDLNPKTEGQDNTQTQAQALGITSIGSNRTKGGLYNTGTVQKIAKSGHIEPRRGTNLTSAQMGGAANDRQATITKPFLAEGDKNTKLFAVDTVSGDVILRGYVEDDQRIVQVVLNFGGTGVSADGTPTGGTDVVILQKGPGFDLVTNQGNRATCTQTVDLNRHRVEWAYLWSTETMPGGNNVVASGVNVYAYARNANAALAVKTRSSSVDENATNNTYNYFNEDYPANFKRYNRIPVNLRPYITGFRRNQQTFAHNTRSRQGWYMFARNETAVVAGFNLLNGTGTTVINLQGMGNYTTGSVGTLSDFGVTAGTAADDNRHYRQFLVSNTAATTGNGVITLTVNGFQAVNTGNGTAANSERAVTITAATQTNSATARPTYILPWNIERSPGTDGSDLWDDFTQAHIWQSNDTAPGSDQAAANTTSGRFASVNRYVILSPAMSIDAANGILWESHNEGGSGYLQNSGTARRTAITTAAATSGNGTSNNDVVMQFVDPIFFSDVYRSPGTTSNAAATWTVSSMIGRSGTYNNWRSLGGIYINGPDGGTISFAGGGNSNNTSAEGNTFSQNLYHGESTWYNASSQNTARTTGNNSGGVATPPSTDQFMNPHIVTSYNTAGTEEHIHVSYYDDKDGSLKYRHNLRGSPDGLDIGASTDTTSTGSTTANQRIPKLWTNLDGGLDLEDVDETGQPTDWTLNQANRGGDIANNNRYLRDRYVTTNGTQVTAGQQIYRFGTNANTPGNTTTIYAPISGTITNLIANTSTTQQTANTDRLFTITPAAANVFAAGQRVVNYTTRNGLTEAQRIKAGKHNAIAVTSQGYPVIAYYDQTNQRLKLAVSRSLAPIQNTDWVIRDYVIPSNNLSSFGTGEFVSMKIDTRDDANIVHIAAMNTAKRLVYVTGQLNPNFTTGNTQQTSGGVLTNVKVQVVDSVGNVGRWCSISLDSNGKPWISYMDESYVGARDGAKVAYLNTTTFYKGVNTGTDSAPAGYFPKEYIDLYGASLEGWETMHVPTTYRVENPVEGPGREHGRLKIECYPTRNYTGTPNPANRFWGAAVSYLSQDADSANAAMDRYRVAYYVK